jgi:surfactin synthase thioesterase subunit
VGKCHLPILLLIADDDLWVGKNQKDEFKRYFSDCRELHLPGKHFLAQSNPSGCAAQINLFLRELAGQ